MKAVLKLVLRRKREAGQELSLQDIKQVVEDIESYYTLAFTEFKELITENPDHFYCEPACRLKPREPENPPPAVTANPADIQELAQARQEIAALTQALKESQDNNLKIQRDFDNQALSYQSLQAKLTILKADFMRMSEQCEREKQQNDVLLLHIRQQWQQLQILQQQQQQTRDSVSDAPASADIHTERQGGSVVPEAAKLPPAASDKPLVPVARVAPFKVEVTPRNDSVTPRTDAVTPHIGAVTVPPALRDTKIKMKTFIRCDIKDKLMLHWAKLMHAFNSARPEFTVYCTEISDREIQVTATKHHDTYQKYMEAVKQMITRKNMTYGDFELVLRKLPLFTYEVNINEVIEALYSMPSSVPS